jgi:hypothetical protein
MVRSRHQHHFDPLDEKYLIETLGDARHARTRVSGKVKINGDLYRALRKVMEAIDDVCVAAGRKRGHFRLKSQ